MRPKIIWTIGLFSSSVFIVALGLLFVPKASGFISQAARLIIPFANSATYVKNGIPASDRSIKAIEKVESRLQEALAVKGLVYGSPIFIRIFKDSGKLELWVEAPGGEFTHFKTYDICTFSGDLGPKLKEGDKQSPEGFYYVKANQLNPSSRFHLSFNLGFPNQYDTFHGRTGSALMIHGNCVSIGCYAMTDPQIEEIYALAHAALVNGQPFFRVHAFPFALTDAALEQKVGHKWHAFWLNLKTGYDAFETQKRPPNVEVKDGLYVFDFQ